MSADLRKRSVETERLVIGIQPVREVLRANPSSIVRITVGTSPNPRVSGLVALAAQAGLTVSHVPMADLDRLARGGMHQGVVATALPLPLLGTDDWLEQLLEAARPYALVLDGIMDPQNFGAAVRSAVALGSGFVAWPEHASAPLSPTTFRASAGAIEHARLLRTPSLSKLLTRAKATGISVLALDTRASASLADRATSGPTLVVIGAEDRGPRKSISSLAQPVRIPISSIGSLNASVAAAVALYELGRTEKIDRKDPA